MRVRLIHQSLKSVVMFECEWEFLSANNFTGVTMDSPPADQTLFGQEYNPREDRGDLPVAPPKSRQQLASLLRKTQGTIVSHIDEERLTAALRHMSLSNVKAGEILFKQGEYSDVFYIVEEGEFHGYKHDVREFRETFFGGEDEREQRFRRCRSRQSNDLGRRCWRYTADDSPCIGPYATLAGYERSTSVKAATDGKLWHIDCNLYTRILYGMDRRERERRKLYLDTVYLLSPVYHEQKTRLIGVIESKKYGAGEVIRRAPDSQASRLLRGARSAHQSTEGGILQIPDFL